MSKLFIFIDESGDPGIKSEGSCFYNLNIIVCSGENSVKRMVSAISLFRYFLNLDGELKDYWGKGNLRSKMIGLSEKVVLDPSNQTFIFHVNKELYTGPYLDKEGQGTKFRNFILKSALEIIFSNDKYENIDSIELVIDKYLESSTDRKSLNDYLRGNYKLPRNAKNQSKIHSIQHVSSLYCDPIQFIDLIGKIKENVEDFGVEKVDISFMKKGKMPGSYTAPSISHL